MIQFRKATLEDIDILVNLRVNFLKEVEKPSNEALSIVLRESIHQFFRKKMHNNEFVSWIATNEGKIIATSGVSFLDVPPSYANASGKEAYIMNLYTLPQFRKRGIGTKLLDKIISEVRKSLVKKIRLHSTEIGKPIYIKKGFDDSNNEMVMYLE